ncbi:MAG: porin family protein [Gemmatimonadetes bacterium]|nr:porin family protein [Gemmatimonadota bacterium]
MLAITLLAFGTSTAAAQVRFGPHLSWGDEADLAIGGKLLFGLADVAGEGSRNLEGSASLDWFLDCEDCSYFEVTGGVLYRFDIGETARPYAGGGLNWGRISYDTNTPGFSSDSEIGLAAMGGIQFPLGNFTAYTDARITLGGFEQAVISFGLLLGGGGSSARVQRP